MEPKKKRRGWLWALGIFAVLVGIGTLAEEDSTAPKPTAAEPEIPCDKTYSGLVYASAERSGVILGRDVSAAQGVVIVVKRSAYERMKLSDQKTLAAAVDCAVAAPGFLSNLHFRATMSGDDLYGLKAADLVGLRREGYASIPKNDG